ncbi:MAG: adenosylcobinamide-GDP ribazoletransferase, partial [Moorella sp. (in: Bacteria)]|nr:adenosylcobinamide-GDP ribazoletransferase [Moorella sp. (in: firmicutes)]
LAAAALAGAVFAGVAVLGQYISGKINGMTGDTLGALTEGAEVLALFCLQVLF